MREEKAKFTLEERRGLPVGIASTRFVADFSRLDGSKDLYVADAVHHTKLAATEAGLHAESTTLLALDDAKPETWSEGHAGFISDSVYTPTPAIPMVLGRPFVFGVRDQVTGTLLFLGRFSLPEQK